MRGWIADFSNRILSVWCLCLFPPRDLYQFVSNWLESCMVLISCICWKFYSLKVCFCLPSLICCHKRCIYIFCINTVHQLFCYLRSMLSAIFLYSLKEWGWNGRMIDLSARILVWIICSFLEWWLKYLTAMSFYALFRIWGMSRNLIISD